MKSIALTLIIVCGFAFNSPSLQALDPDKPFSQYVLDAWSIEQGLPQITVHSLTQDDQGYMWIGTQAGVARFDGVSFTTYSSDNTPELPGNFIQDLLTDSKGRVWIATYKGLTRYEKGSFTHINRDTDNQPLQLNVLKVDEDPHGRIWLSTVEGLYCVEQDKLVRYTKIPQTVSSVYTANNALFVGGVGNLWRMNGDQFQQISLPAEYQDSTISQMIWHNSTLWLGTNNGLLIYSPESGQINEFQTSTALYQYPVDALGTDSDNNLWVGTINGLYRIRSSQVVEHVPNDNPHNFQQVLTIYEDHEQNLWFGSYRDGIARLWNGRTRRYSVSSGLNEPLVWSVLPTLDDKGIWTGTNLGLSLLKDGTFEQLIKPEDLPHPTVYTLLQEADKLWIGTRKGLATYSDGKAQLTAHKEQLSTLQINSIFRDSQQRLWLGTSNGLFQYTEQRLIPYTTKSGEFIFIRPITELSDGRLMVGSQKGLHQLIDGQLVPVGLDKGLNLKLDVSDIEELPNSVSGQPQMVISTISQGLYFLRNGQWHRLSEQDGMPVNESFTVINDGNDHLWVSGFKGLYQTPLSHIEQYIDKQRDDIFAYMILSESGGILGSQKGFCCNGAGNAKGFLHNGQLWYPTRDGAVNIDPANIRLNQILPNVVIERIQYNDNWHSTYEAQRFNLAQNQRDVKFDFTALSYRDPKSVLFKYRLVGYQDDWQMLDPKAQRRVNYTNLPPGNYSFQVQASNNAGLWSKQTAELHFTIAPYFYESFWFYILIIITTAILINFWHKLRTRSLQAKKQELEDKIKQHTQQLEVSNQKLHEAVEALKETSQTDQLTGLKNRRYLASQLPADLAHFERELTAQYEGDTMIFALVDIDHFKNINDTYGHKAGDDVIQKFSEVIRDHIREGDYAVRWGGEEFIIVFRPMPGPMAPIIINRLRLAIERTTFKVSDDKTETITCSIGFAEYPFFKQDIKRLSWEHTIELADHALYTVKENGRNGWACFNPTDKTPISKDLLFTIKNDLDSELEAGRLKLNASFLIDDSKKPGE
jgi:diguanylate cyclase (GGDEF)-like protein